MRITCFARHLFVFVLFISLVAGMRQTAFANIRSYKQKDDGVLFVLDKGILNIQVCAGDIIHVAYTLFDSLPAKNSLLVTAAWKEKVPFSVTENSTSVIIQTQKLILSVNKETQAIQYADAAGKLVLAEAPDSNKAMLPVTIAGSNTYNCITTFNSPQDEGLFGLGCHPLDSLSINYKGRNQDLAIRYLTGAVPVILSTKGYGLMWDNYSASSWYGGEENNSKFKYVSESGNRIDYYFFYGPKPDDVIARYRQTTGEAPMYGKWAFGLFQSQDRYRYQKEVLGVANNYRGEHIPVDVIVQDWYYWEPLPIGSHVMNAERYPNPKAMIDSLHDKHLHAMISIWPVFGSGTRNFNALRDSGDLTTITWDNVVTHTFDTYYDAHSPKARLHYWQQARDSLVKRYGWDAWWIDQCEPDNGSLLDERKKASFYTGKGIDYFNTYSLVHTDGVYNNWRKDIPGKRAFFLARQAFAGEQRNAATLWSSDIECKFSVLKNQVPQGINACYSGIPYWTSDIGGYHYHWQAPDWSTPENRELFTRWFQFGAFCPVFRIHGKGERALFSDNWDEKTKQILLHYDQLRYRLLPYIYSLSAKVTREGYTIMRGLVFDFQSDTAVYNIKDQYMFGPAFLVNPVVQPANTLPKENIRQVYLPKANWYNFWNGTQISGGVTIDASAPVEQMPLFVKAGSVLPMGPFMEYATQKKNDTVELRIYPGADGSFTLYEDENDNYNYEKGNYATISFIWNDHNKTLTIGKTNGSFAGQLKKRVFNIVLVKANHGIDMMVTKDPDKRVTYSGREMKISFK